MSVDLVLRVLGASTHTEASKIEKPPRGAASARGSTSHHAIGNLRSLDVVDGDLARAAVLGGVERHLLAFDEAAQAGALEGGRMDETSLPPLSGWMKPKPFWSL
jgi:hypothetical protein